MRFSRFESKTKNSTFGKETEKRRKKSLAFPVCKFFRYMSIAFRTELSPQFSGLSIDHQDGILAMGSCFAVHIGQYLCDYKFSALINPFGIVFNPISIGNGLHYLMSDRLFTANDVFQHQEQWHSFLHHSRFSGVDREATLAAMNEALQQARAFLPKVNRLLLTLGTANVFVFKETSEIVANCHKLPGRYFERKRLGVEPITEAIEPMLRAWKEQNPDLQVVLSVSPVRHTRDGLIENQRSKATLLLAAEVLCRDMDFVHYFPAYELMMDDLRDYRFYQADLTHPNEVAIEYIWHFFQHSFLEDNTRALMPLIRDVLQAARHRPFQPHAASHQVFLRKQLQQIEQLTAQYPFLNFEQERTAFEEQLI